MISTFWSVRNSSLAFSSSIPLSGRAVSETRHFERIKFIFPRLENVARWSPSASSRSSFPCRCSYYTRSTADRGCVVARACRLRAGGVLSNDPTIAPGAGAFFAPNPGKDGAITTQNPRPYDPHHYNLRRRRPHDHDDPNPPIDLPSLRSPPKRSSQ